MVLFVRRMILIFNTWLLHREIIPMTVLDLEEISGLNIHPINFMPIGRRRISMTNICLGWALHLPVTHFIITAAVTISGDLIKELPANLFADGILAFL